MAPPPGLELCAPFRLRLVEALGFAAREAVPPASINEEETKSEEPAPVLFVAASEVAPTALAAYTAPALSTDIAPAPSTATAPALSTGTVLTPSTATAPAPVTGTAPALLTVVAQARTIDTAPALSTDDAPGVDVPEKQAPSASASLGDGLLPLKEMVSYGLPPIELPEVLEALGHPLRCGVCWTHLGTAFSFHDGLCGGCLGSPVVWDALARPFEMTDEQRLDRYVLALDVARARHPRLPGWFGRVDRFRGDGGDLGVCVLSEEDRRVIADYEHVSRLYWRLLDAGDDGRLA